METVGKSMDEMNDTSNPQLKQVSIKAKVRGDKGYIPSLFSFFKEPSIAEDHAQEFLNTFLSESEAIQIKMLEGYQHFKDLFQLIAKQPTQSLSMSFLNELIALLKQSEEEVSQIFKPLTSLMNETLGVTFDDELRRKYYSFLLLLKPKEEYQDVQSCSRRIYESLYDFDLYYDLIKEHTIESVIIPLMSINDKSNLLVGKLSPELEVQIKDSISKLGGQVFFKMRRSPKDAYSRLDKEINGEWKKYWSIDGTQDPRECFMRIQSVEQLLLLCKSSERIQEDLVNYESQSIVLRKYEPNIGVEFRCFICNGCLNAVTLQPNQLDIDATKQYQPLKDFVNSDHFTKVFSSIGYSHAVVDIAIDSNLKIVKIIEINPFGKMAQSGYFSWVMDKQILYHGYQLHNEVTLRLQR